MKNASNCGTYDWSIIDGMLAETATYGNQAAIRIYLTYPGGTGTHPANAIPACYNGNVAMRPDTYWNVTHPDYDSAFLNTALRNFITAFGARYDGDPRLGFVHMGLVGLWGEWHTWPYDTDTADGLPNYMPTDANGAALIAAYDSAFNKTKIELRYPGAAGGAANSRDIGYHDDSFCFREGSPLQGVTLPVSMGGASYGQLQRTLDAGVENKWITSSIGGELRPEIQSTAFQSWPNGSGAVDNLKACIELSHASWMINEGSGGYSSSDANVAAAVRLMGYNLTADNAYYKNTASGTTNVGVAISNTGVAPFYYPWQVTLGLQNSAGTVVKNLGHTLGPAHGPAPDSPRLPRLGHRRRPPRLRLLAVFPDFCGFVRRGVRRLPVGAASQEPPGSGQRQRREETALRQHHPADRRLARPR